jgi:hypothetical protein
MILAIEMREHDFMCEQRNPFKGGGAVCIGAANEFMLAVGHFDEAGLTESADELIAEFFWN